MNISQLSYKKRTVLLIIIATLIRLLFGSMVELNNDEVYYVTYAKELQWNYFDHPPMVALCIKFFTAGLQLHHELFVRLGAIIAAAICTWLMYLIGQRLMDERTGWLAACLFTASFYSSIIAGALIMPDSPQLVFWLWSVYLMVNIIQNDKHDKSININLLLIGFAIGCCMLSKVHGIFCWGGFGLYIIFHRRALLRNPFLYLSVLISFLMLVPSLMWTFSSHMSTYDYHSSRMQFSGFKPDSFFRELGGSFLYNNPVLVVVLVAALIHYKKIYASIGASAFRLLLYLGFPLIATTLFLSLFNDTLPHWSGPAYTTLIIVSAIYLSQLQLDFARKIVLASITTICVALTAAIGIINFWPGTLGSKTLPDYGKNDVTLDMSGWRQFGSAFQKFYQQDTAQLHSAPRFIYSDYWFPAAHLDYYVASPMQLYVKGVGNVNDIHHFAWLNKKLPALNKGETAYFITISNFNDNPPEELVKSFSKISVPIAIPQYRNGELARYFYVYRLEGTK